MEGDSSGIQFTGQAQPVGADAEWLRSTLVQCAAHLPAQMRRATIEFVHDARMQALHAQFSGDDSTTDVLTFAASSPGEPIDCDIAVCVDEAARRATELGHEPRHELLLYGLHALLHTCGHDDRDAASHAAMHAEEDRILNAVGVGAIFAPRAPGPARPAVSAPPHPSEGGQ